MIKLKDLLPNEDLVLYSNLSVEEVMRRIKENVGPKVRSNYWNRPISCKSYEGDVYGNIFDIKKVIDYRNSFLPVIHGIVYLDANGKTGIILKMRLAPFVKAFILLWLLFTGLACIGFLIKGIINYNNILKGIGKIFEHGVPVPFFLFLFGCAITVIPFKIESRKSIDFFKVLLRANV